MAALQPYEAELFEEARTLGASRAAGCARVRRDDLDGRPFAAARFVDCPSRAPATVVARVDHTAFTRGHTVAGEVCEIVGVGPIPVAVARRLADDAFLKALIHDGTDVLAVSHLGRSIPARLRTAVEELYPECALGAVMRTDISRSTTTPRSRKVGSPRSGTSPGCATSTTPTNTRTTCGSPASEQTNTSSRRSARGDP